MYALLARRGLAINSPPALPPPTGDIKDLRGAYLALQQKNKQIHGAGLSELPIRSNLNALTGDWLDKLWLSPTIGIHAAPLKKQESALGIDKE